MYWECNVCHNAFVCVCAWEWEWEWERDWEREREGNQTWRQDGCNFRYVQPALNTKPPHPEILEATMSAQHTQPCCIAQISLKTSTSCTCQHLICRLQLQLKLMTMIQRLPGRHTCPGCKLNGVLQAHISYLASINRAEQTPTSTANGLLMTSIDLSSPRPESVKPTTTQLPQKSWMSSPLVRNNTKYDMAWRENAYSRRPPSSGLNHTSLSHWMNSGIFETKAG